MKAKTMTLGSVRIRQNRFDNWYGYIGTRRVEMFSNSSTETAEQAANRWLAENEIKVEDDGECLVATAPLGYTWTARPGCHSLIVGSGLDIDDDSFAGKMKRLKALAAEGLEPCPHCRRTVAEPGEGELLRIGR